MWQGIRIDVTEIVPPKHKIAVKIKTEVHLLREVTKKLKYYQFTLT